MKADALQAVYIDGVEHLGQRERNTLYLDDPSLPARRCRAIVLDDSSWRWLLNRHGAVRTNGVSISMTPPRQPVSEVKWPEPRQEPRRPSLATKIINVIKEHYK